MVSINYAFREISCKIVYYGPGLSGKTTNLQYVHNRVPSKSRGELISLATEADRTLYFDFLPINVGDIAGFSTKFQLYTVPGQVFYNATRKLVLRGVDGIVFVADSQASKLDDNIESLANMYENLKENGLEISVVPVVMQYNKRDLPEVMSVEELNKAINKENWPVVEASAVSGKGVFDTLKRITKMVLEETRRKTVAGATPPQQAATVANKPGSPLPTGQSPAVTPEPEPVGVAADSGGWRVPAGTQVPSTAAKPKSKIGTSPIVSPEPAWESQPEGASVETAETTPEIPDSMTEGGNGDKVENAKSSTRPSPSAPSLSSINEGAVPRIVQAQRSRRIISKRKSFLARLFGRLFGR